MDHTAPEIKRPKNYKSLHRMQRIITLGRQAGLSRLEDIETFLLVCAHPGLTSFELIEQAYDSKILTRNLYSRFMYGLKKLGPGTPRRMRGLGLIDLSTRKTTWHGGALPFNIRLTTKGKALRDQFDKL